VTTVLVTGGAGFIGSHIVDAYVKRGWAVRVLDDLSSGLRENVNPAAELLVGDLRDESLIERAIDGVDLVNHHAAQIDVRKSVNDPAFDADVNVVGSLRLLQAAVAAKVKKFIFASSGGATYGEPLFAPQNELHPQYPVSPYGCSKLALEGYLHYYRVVHGLETVALRYANVYGPRQRAEGEAGVIAIFGGKLIRGEAVTINGDGAQTRDYVSVQDVVRANMAVSELPLSGAFNVGTGIETSVNELFDIMCDVGGFPSNAAHGPTKKGEQQRSVLDGSKLRQAASLPDPVSLREGMAKTIAWLRTQESVPS
jgi:UDP-glucose 4-epimerase